MIFPLTGTLDYFAGAVSGHLFVTQAISVAMGGWLTEAPLWIQWQHRGVLSAHEHCSVVDLNSYRFRKVVAHRSYAMQAFRKYAELFSRTLMQAASDGTYIDDLWGTPSGPPSSLFEDLHRME